MAFTLRLPDDLLERVDERRGDVARNTFIVRAIESYLDGVGMPSPRLQAAMDAAAVEHAAEAIVDAALDGLTRKPDEDEAPNGGSETPRRNPAPSLTGKTIDPAVLRRQLDLNKKKGL